MARKVKRSSDSRAAALKAVAAAAAGPAVNPPTAPHPAAETRPVKVDAAVQPGARPAAVAASESRSDRRPTLLVLLVAALLMLGVIGFAGGRMLAGPDDPLDGIVVGEPRGGVLASTPEPTERPTAEPTVEPTATPAPIAVATPMPATPAPAPVGTPAPPVMVAMAVTPDETVQTWYSYVENGEFDAAYALWSQRMRANFPREGNLDNRWRDTADITFSQLYVVSQTQTTATVQVDFVETKDDGSSRRFIGWWELVRSGDGWLLDQPHF